MSSKGRQYRDGTVADETTENEFSELSDNPKDQIKFRVSLLI